MCGGLKELLQLLQPAPWRWYSRRLDGRPPHACLDAPPQPARHVEGLPVAALGDVTVDGLRRMLGAAGAKPGGPRHIVVTDLREELVL